MHEDGRVSAVKTDPRRRRDNRCAVCRKPLPKVTVQMRKYAGDQIERDAFCSSKCCRAWHGTSLALTGQERRALAELENDKTLVNV